MCAKRDLCAKRRSSFLWKTKLGYKNVEQSMENSSGPVYDLS